MDVAKCEYCVGMQRRNIAENETQHRPLTFDGTRDGVRRAIDFQLEIEYLVYWDLPNTLLDNRLCDSWDRPDRLNSVIFLHPLEHRSLAHTAMENSTRSCTNHCSSHRHAAQSKPLLGFRWEAEHDGTIYSLASADCLLIESRACFHKSHDYSFSRKFTRLFTTMWFLFVAYILQLAYALPANQGSSSCTHDALFTSLSRDGSSFCSSLLKSHCDKVSTPAPFTKYPSTKIRSYVRNFAIPDYKWFYNYHS